MGCYCFNTENMQLIENEQNKSSPITNIELISRKIINDNNSNNTNKNNNYSKNKNINSNKGFSNALRKKTNSEKKITKYHDFSVDKMHFKPQITLNNDVIVSGNEINPEKIYIKKQKC